MIGQSVNEQQNYVNGRDVLHEANLNIGSIRCGTPATVVDVGDEYNRQEQQNQFTGWFFDFNQLVDNVGRLKVFLL